MLRVCGWNEGPGMGSLSLSQMFRGEEVESKHFSATNFPLSMYDEEQMDDECDLLNGMKAPL